VYHAPKYRVVESGIPFMSGSSEWWTLTL